MFTRISKIFKKKGINYLNYFLFLLFPITSFFLYFQLYLVNELQFRIFIIELGYGLMLFIPIFLISLFLRKTRYQFDLVMILSGICAYGAYLADLMTKSTPNWGNLRTNLPFIIVAIPSATVKKWFRCRTLRKIQSPDNGILLFNHIFIDSYKEIQGDNLTTGAIIERFREDWNKVMGEDKGI